MTAARTTLMVVMTFLAPVLVLAGTGIGAWMLFQRTGTLERDIAKTDVDILRVTQQIESTNVLRPKGQVATREMNAFEERDFLTLIQGYAGAARVTVTKWTNATPVAPAATPSGFNQANQGDPKKKTLPPGIMSIGSTLELAGNYADIQLFLYTLLQDERLFNVNDIKWRRGDKWPKSELSLTLTRYVHAPQAIPGVNRNASSVGGAPVGGAVPGSTQSFPALSGAGSP